MDQTTQNTPSTSPPRQTRYVYTVIEREGAKAFWTKIGAAWTNRDGSITARLDALPVNGMLQIRDADERRDRGGAP